MYSRIVSVMAPLTAANFKQNQSFDQMFKVICRLFTTMANLTKYFITTKATSENLLVSKFDSLVAKLSKMITAKVNLLIVAEKENNPKKKAAEARLTLKEAKTIPTLIYKHEAFEKDVIKLDSRVKLGLSAHLRPSSARDFRLKIEEEPREDSVADEDAQSSERESQDSDDEDGHLAESTRIDNSQSSANSQATQASLRESNGSPPAKKMKVKMPFNATRR